MSLFNRSIPRLVQEFVAKQPKKVSYKCRDKGEQNWVADFDGSIEIRTCDLKNGSLPFKIGRLAGDLICCFRQFNASLLPEELVGKIIFKHPLLGTYTRKSRFKIGEEVCCLAKNKSAYNKVKRIIFTSCYTDDLTIVEDIRYVVGDHVEETVSESETFVSGKELKEWLSNPCGADRPQPNGQEITTSYAVGDEVWFMKDNKPTRQIICGAETEVTLIGEELHQTDRYSVKDHGEILILEPEQMYDNRLDLAKRF